jgi:hypothetical protein
MARVFIFFPAGGDFLTFGAYASIPFTVSPWVSRLKLRPWIEPASCVPQDIQPVALSISQKSLVLTASEVSGSIWTLDNADK